MPRYTSAGALVGAEMHLSPGHLSNVIGETRWKVFVMELLAWLGTAAVDAADELRRAAIG